MRVLDITITKAEVLTASMIIRSDSQKSLVPATVVNKESRSFFSGLDTVHDLSPYID